MVCDRTKLTFAAVKDEIFHVAQTQHYFNGGREWNDKITTPPALYWLGVAWCKFWNLILNDDRCSTLRLRLLNAPLSTAVFMLSRSIIARSLRDSSMASWHAFNIALMPVVFFFNVLFYTDILGVVLILAAYRLSLGRRWIVSAAFGALSVLVRQTNIVWVCYIAGVAVLEALKPRHIKSVSNLIAEAVRNRRMVLGIVSPYAVIVASFVAYIHVFNNGSIVLGDKSNHRAGLHLPQLFYFSVFAVGAGGWAFIDISFVLKQYFGSVLSRPVSTSISYIFCAWIVYTFTVEHPFLLADNRHYTFYLWRRVYQRWYPIRFLLIPLYHICFRSINGLFLSADCGILNVLDQAGFWLCTSLVLIPSPLIEFRYFMVPWLIFRLRIRIHDKRALVMESLTWMISNALLLFIYLRRPFVYRGAEGDEIGRFMF
eukprot:Partr_v1_DN28014_c1_g1_i6_m57104 putative adds the third glucose residue to the lipid-linked oligosaccharide precursor for N-linked glycosylation. Transfers glucose from dolichyl phosphate glucose (Dol-P-Glc) onto the lipid-linked oligosaccharide Glc(2)Man(9)GlcNAc(2)-PP-Dol